ncbi:MAG: hypothetical protein CHACPFDD_02798 [Phycisphaerae bacterium]|nr:hypothetical protein [Phycisphaerae bacterium]
MTGDSGTRTADMTYDALSRLLTLSVASTEHRGSGLLELTQTWDYDDWQSAGEVSVTAGPDGQETTYTFAADDLGRPASVIGGGMSMTYAYDDASRVDYVDYGNGTRVDYEYDDANRVTTIAHLGLAPNRPVLYQTDYEWNPNNTIATRTETDNSSGSTVETVVTFGYDDRDRLTRETRVRQGDPDVTEYDIEYLYDDLGNRLQKSQTTATENGDVTVVTDYVYDITEPNQEFVTNNNRLMYYTETVDSELRRTVYYTYYETGDVSNITIKDETDTSVRKDLALTYARNGGLWLAVWGEYAVDENGDYVADSYVPTLAREFRYESARGRYMSRDYTTNGYTNPGLWEPATAWTYTEYVGDTPIADWEIDLDGQTNEPVWTRLRTYLPGSSSGDAAGAQLNASDDSIQYYHGDLVGSTVGTTDADGTNGVFDGPAITVAYTAFGELVANDGSDNISIGLAAPAGFPRYQYCGAWGYETGAADGSGALLSLTGHDSSLPPITLMHVGARWYDPALGRFVQRDATGLAGGINSYQYTTCNPLLAPDPSGAMALPPPPHLPPWHPLYPGPPDPSRNFWCAPRPPSPPVPPPIPWWRMWVCPIPGTVGTGFWTSPVAVGTASGAATAGAVAVGAAAGGAAAGYGINQVYGRYNRGYRISDGLADWLYRRWTVDSNYDPYGEGR